MMRSLLILAGLVGTTVGFQFLPPREHLNQNGTIMCYKRDNNCTMEVRITSEDNPDLLYFESADALDRTDVTQTNNVGELITGAGTQSAPWLITIDLSCDDGNATGSAALALGDYDGETLTTRIVVKQNYDPRLTSLNFAEDVRYTAVCNFSLVNSTILQGGILYVSGGREEDPGPPQTDTVILSARLVSDPTADVTSVVQAQQMFWVASIKDANNSQATGVKIYSCEICNTIGCTDVSYPYILNSGCSANPTFYTGFTDLTAAELTGEAVTSTFAAFRITPSSSVVYLRCNGDLCYSPIDPTCRDLCTYTSGRKKRQADEPEGDGSLTLVTELNILAPRKGSVDILGAEWIPTNEKESDREAEDASTPIKEENSVLLPVVIAMSVLAVIVIIVTIGACFHLSRKRRGAAQKI